MANKIRYHITIEDQEAYFKQLCKLNSLKNLISYITRLGENEYADKDLINQMLEEYLPQLVTAFQEEEELKRIIADRYIQRLEFGKEIYNISYVILPLNGEIEFSYEY